MEMEVTVLTGDKENTGTKRDNLDGLLKLNAIAFASSTHIPTCPSAVEMVISIASNKSQLSSGLACTAQAIRT
ncbi:hypothetical protein V6N12_039692 [Hibiscus sabdariffa]|uniref:Uncharacterized protein n=1 Tax=Hibiscus sabdariffa TaxID=183260 RepID=A0ABR2E506_9ROSI